MEKVGHWRWIVQHTRKLPASVVLTNPVAEVTLGIVLPLLLVFATLSIPSLFPYGLFALFAVPLTISHAYYRVSKPSGL